MGSPVNQTGFPHSQVAHHNHFGDFESARCNKKEEATRKWVTKQTPTVLQPGGLTRSPHGAGSLLLTGDLHFVVKVLLPVQSRLSPVILRKRREEEVWGRKLFQTPDGISPLRQLPGGAGWWLGLYARGGKHSWRELGPTSGLSVDLKAGRGKRSQPSRAQHGIHLCYQYTEIFFCFA